MTKKSIFRDQFSWKVSTFAAERLRNCSRSAIDAWSLLSLKRSFGTRNNEKLDINMVSAAFKNRTREEIIAAFRESIRRKHEWQERAEEEIKKIRQERLK